MLHLLHRNETVKFTKLKSEDTTESTTEGTTGGNDETTESTDNTSVAVILTERL